MRVTFHDDALWRDDDGWHLPVKRKDQVDAVAAMMDLHPGPERVVVHIGSHRLYPTRGLANTEVVRDVLLGTFRAWVDDFREERR